MSIRDLKPTSLWNHFYSLTQIPRPSKKEAEAVAFLEKFGKELGLEVIKEECGNIIIRKPATKGMEDRKGVILQAHVDMVPQKNSDKVHNFETDPIETRIVDGWVMANGTTLGADNGLGVAAAMAVLSSNDIEHGPVEALITIDEEAGMTGARLLQPDSLKGDILLNLDSEDEGELFVGCAGGIDVNAKIKYETKSVPAGHVGYSLSITGLKGGHSGMDIVLGRGNANKAMTRILLPLMEEHGVQLASIEGGSLRNAIPREAFAQITVPANKVKEVESIVDRHFNEMKVELAAHEADLNIVLESAALPSTIIDPEVALKAVRAIYAAPNGVERMSDALPGVVESSNNLAIVSSKNGVIEVKSLTRSSVDSAKAILANAIKNVFVLAGGSVEFGGEYPGWRPNMDSPILGCMKESYKNLYGKEPGINVIHAGLECGILGAIYPNWDMVSFGPTIRSPHSPDERTEIASVEKWWNYLVEVLKNIPKKN